MSIPITPGIYVDEPRPALRDCQVEIRSPDGAVSVHAIPAGRTRFTVQIFRRQLDHRQLDPLAFPGPFTVDTLEFDVPPEGRTIRTPEGYIITNRTLPAAPATDWWETQAAQEGLDPGTDTLRQTEDAEFYRSINTETLRQPNAYRTLPNNIRLPYPNPGYPPGYPTDRELGRRIQGGTYPNNSTMTTAGMSTPSTMTPERLIEFLKENIEIRTKLTLAGTDLTFRTQMIVRHNNQETIVSDDEDSVDLDGLLDHL